MLTATDQTTTTTATHSFSYGTNYVVVMEKQINPNPNLKEESPRKVSGNGGGGSGGDSKLKRDEWSEGAVSSLLEAYESKWVLRNRAKLKGHDWEDVARQVSGRANFSKSPKTQTQCKNKIESMKKRYRSESATADGSTWPLYPRLDLLLRGTGNGAVTTSVVQAPATALEEIPPAAAGGGSCAPMMLLEAVPMAHPPLRVAAAIPSPPPVAVGIAQNSLGSNGVDRTQKEEADEAKASMEHNMAVDTDSSTPALYSGKSDKMMLRSSEKRKTTNNNNNNKTEHAHKRKKVKKTREDRSEIAESIRWLAEAVVKAEQARMETMKEIERMRVEAEAKRAEMELKRTEIVANTQLEIARMFAASNGKGVDSSLRIGRS